LWKRMILSAGPGINMAALQGERYTIPEIRADTRSSAQIRLDELWAIGKSDALFSVKDAAFTEWMELQSEMNANVGPTERFFTNLFRPKNYVANLGGTNEFEGLVMTVLSGANLAKVMFAPRISVMPGSYLAGKAPRYVTPGTQVLEGQYVNDLGRVEPWKSYYDEYGRMIGRTDFNAGNQSAGIPDVHYHNWEYNSQYPMGRQIPGHFPGEYKP
jgi:hypothetical protein